MLLRDQLLKIKESKIRIYFQDSEQVKAALWFESQNLQRILLALWLH